VSIEKLKENHDVTTSWVAFPLHPNTPPEGLLMKDLYKNRDPDQMKATGDYLKSQMAEAGLPYNRRTRLDNSRLAQELGAWADTQAGGDAFHDAMFTAYFVDDRNIGDADELVTIAGSVGLDELEAGEVLKQRSFSPNVTRDWERAWSEGVTGVPTFTARDLFVFGCQPYEVLMRFFNHLKKLQAEDSASS
jgi:predicted DsbA family dithiol-disulfide isomerase